MGRFVINYNTLCVKIRLILMARYLNVRSSAHVDATAYCSLNHYGVQSKGVVNVVLSPYRRH